MNPELDDDTKALLATMTQDERDAYLEGLDDSDMQGAINEANAMSEKELRAALAGKDDPEAKKPDADGNKEGEQGAAADASAGDAKKEGEASDDGKVADSAAANAEGSSNDAGAAAEADEPVEPFRPVLRAEVPEKADEIKRKIESAQDELEKKFREGEIDFETYKASERKLSGQLQQIRDAELQARIYADQQAQTAQQEWIWNVKQFKRQAKKNDGIDYDSDEKLNKDLDVMIRALASDPDNASKGADYFLEEAHKRVLVLRGIAPKRAAKADDAKAEANAARKPPTESIPKTVGDIPGGGDPSDTGTSEFAALDKLTGEAFERALAKLSAEQRSRYLMES